MNLNFKLEMYPDLNSHLNTPRLEYPNSSSGTNIADLTESNTKLNSNNNHVLASNKNKNDKRNRRLKNPGRYVTQPITLIEIKELEDEDEKNTQTSNYTKNTNRKDKTTIV